MNATRIVIIGTGLLFVLAALAGSSAAAQDTLSPAKANEYFQAKDWGNAAAAYESLAQADPSNSQAWFRLGLARHELGEYEKAVEAFQQASTAGMPPGPVWYRTTRALAKLGKREEALAQLNQLAQGGFANAALLEGDPDLEGLRHDARYAAAIQQIQKNARPCDHDPNYRMFDFWVGEWDVTVQGQRAGTNRIELIENNCIVFENWTGAQGGSGRSFNFYNNQTKKWNQVWVASNGSNLQFEGEFRDGTLYYKATTVGANGAKTLHELTFFNLGPGHVRQLWKSSTDGGATWNTVFDGEYRKRPAPGSAGTQAPSTPPCPRSPEFRQLDFWVGEWQVTTAAGQPAGESSIQQILGDCIILENWKGANSFEGKSFNLFNRRSKQWEQTWVDMAGNIRRFTGEFRDGKMHYMAEDVDPQGKPILVRMILSPQGPDRVRQLSEFSADGGATWQPRYDFIYNRKK